MSDPVVLVNDRGEAIGTGDKTAVHQPPGRLHRAISVFVFNSDGQMLLQRRAEVKYHFAGRWANTACSHPAPGEPVLDAAHRRLREEMGLEVALREIGSFVYRAQDPVGGLVEHEFDHVLVGITDESPQPDPAEVAAWEWRSPARVWAMVTATHPDYAPWLLPAMEAFPELRAGHRRP